ncbi:MAG: hypothetical protein GY760_23990 [Deltaproteobacteria bacterium]|nr:hypothetical protein [Deltaproteobacteria bacterium]
MRFPDIHEVIFEPCCTRQLEAIKGCIAAFEFADKWLVIGSGLAIFMGPSGRGGATPTVGSMKGTEWSLLAQALSTIPAIRKTAIYNMAALHKLDHERTKGTNGQKIRMFWTATAEAIMSQ